MLTLTEDAISNTLDLEGRGWVSQHHAILAHRSPGGGLGEVKGIIEAYEKGGVELRLWWSGPHTLEKYEIGGRVIEAATLTQLLRDIKNA